MCVVHGRVQHVSRVNIPMWRYLAIEIRTVSVKQNVDYDQHGLHRMYVTSWYYFFGK